MQILQELGFYDGGTTQIKKIEKKSIDYSNDIVQQIKDLTVLYESGVITKEEFEKAKQKLLN